MSINLQIQSTFENEFGFISHKFVVLEERLIDLAVSKTAYIYHPGVYVFINSLGVIKVGRHLTNSRKRALEHIVANTLNEKIAIASLVDDFEAKVMLFNVKDPNDSHWVAAVEIFLEKELDPIIKSKRN